MVGGASLAAYRGKARRDRPDGYGRVPGLAVAGALFLALGLYFLYNVEAGERPYAAQAAASYAWTA